MALAIVSTHTNAPGPTTHRVTQWARGYHTCCGLCYSRGISSCRNSSLLSWPVSLLAFALGWRVRRADYFFYTGHEEAFCSLGATISVFQGYWKILEDKLDITGFSKISLNEILSVPLVELYRDYANTLLCL